MSFVWRAAYPAITAVAIILFGMDAVAREIQDPFGFDDNDLNVQGYESAMFYNVEATIDGPLRIKTRDFAAKDTHVRSEDGARLADHVSGSSEFMGVQELDAGLEAKENLWSLSNMPWKINGQFSDLTKAQRKSASKMNNAKRKIDKKDGRTSTFYDSVLSSKGEEENEVDAEDPTSPVGNSAWDLADDSQEGSRATR